MAARTKKPMATPATAIAALVPIARTITPDLAAWNDRWSGPIAGTEHLRITADIEGRIALPSGPMAIDSLLAAMVARRLGLPPMLLPTDALPIEIPIERAPGGAFHLASFSIGAFERFGVKWTNRRFPIAEAQTLGSSKIRTISIKAGPCKSYRLPLPAGHITEDKLVWYVVGDAAEIRYLLSLCSYLGKRRAVGLGRTVRWTVEPCEPWGPGFPVVADDGTPLRTLPADWPGVREGAEQAYKTITYPYVDKTREVLCYAPGGMPA